MSRSPLRLWADAFRRARAGRTVIIGEKVEEGEKVQVSSVDLTTQAAAAPVLATVISAVRVNVSYHVKLRFEEQA